MNLSNLTKTGIISIFFIINNSICFAQFGGGTGTQDKPYEIYTIEHLMELSDSVSNYWPINRTDKSNWSIGKYFKLMNDIIDSVRLAIGYGGIMYGGYQNECKYFQGDFNGNNKKITLSLNGKWVLSPIDGQWYPVGRNFIGLFTGIYEAEIYDLTVDGYVKGISFVGGVCGKSEKSNISHCKNYCNVIRDGVYSESAGYVGGICGYVYGECHIYNCNNYRNILSNYNYTGGIVGINYGSIITNCSNYGNVDGGEGTSGICGATSTSVIFGCENYGNINGVKWVGGICGSFSSSAEVFGASTLYNCANYGNVTGTNTLIGGIAGIAGIAGYGIIMSNCRNTGNVKGYNAVGGISGCFGGNIVSQFSYLINNGNVSGVRGVGGISGHLHYGDTLSYCLNIGTVQGDSIVGGIIGGYDNDNLFYDGTGTIHTCHNSGLVIGNNIVGGIQGRCWGEIHNSLNTGVVIGNTNTGGIAGEVNKTAVIKNCYYDKQMCIHGGIAVNDIVGQAKGYLTKELIGNNLQNKLGNTDWTFNNANLYPTLKHFENDSVAFVASSPVYLYDSDVADFDRQNKVRTNFKVNLENDVKWNRIIGNVDVVNDDGLVRSSGSDTLVASIGNYKKLVPINIQLLPISDVNFTIWATEHKQIAPTETNYSIPIYIKSNAKTLQEVTIKKLIIEIDNRIFYAKRSDNGTLAGKNQNEITIENIKIPALNAGEEVVLFNLIGDMLLGNIDSSEIIINPNVEFAEKLNTEPELKNGHITLNICREGSDRFIEIAGNSPSIIIKNNPVEDILEVECNVVESGKYVLEVVDITGRSVKVEEFVAGGAGTFQFEIDVRQFNIGRYMLVIGAPSGKRFAEKVVKR